MERYNIMKYKWIKPALLVLCGFVAGWLLFHDGGTSHAPGNAGHHEHEHGEVVDQVWTCSMHPQIRADKPGKCPLCGMDLIPVNTQATAINADAVQMSPEAIKLASIQTSVVGRQQAVREVSLFGKVQADERLARTQAAHVAGRIEELLVNYTGERVAKGQVIARIYSPALITAQEELLQAKKMTPAQPVLVEAARSKLLQWKLTPEQVETIEQSGEKKVVFDVKANVSGIVIAKKVNEGDYVAQGDVLLEVSDLSRVWVLFDAYESDLPWIRKGDATTFRVEALPGKDFSGTVTFIDPLLDPSSRVARVRVEAANAGGELKPEMFVKGNIKSALKDHSEALAVPRSAVLWTGQRSVVYVKTPGTVEPEFSMREIDTGPTSGNVIVVTGGLHEGEEIVVNGTFVIDAAAQLAGKPSMMEHDTHCSQAETHAHSNPDGEGPEFTDPDFKAALTEVYKAYIIMKDAFVTSDPAKTGTAAKAIGPALKKADPTLLKGYSQMAWIGLAEKMTKSAELISGYDDIERQRNELMSFVEALYKSIRAFGLQNAKAYYQYCSMANDNKGAYWISDSKEVVNPYWGDKMLHCGEVKETLFE